MTTKHLDIGCGTCPRNPYGHDELHGVDISVSQIGNDATIRLANLSLEPIPYPDSYFDSVSAFDFLEHVPRILGTHDGNGTRFPFIDLMNEISRVLKPKGRFYAVTPAYPNPRAFVDPTHVNVITLGTWQYFCGSQALGRIYGFTGSFEMLRNEWAIHPQAFSAEPIEDWRQRWRRFRKLRKGKLSHVMWEFSSTKPE